MNRSKKAPQAVEKPVSRGRRRNLTPRQKQFVKARAAGKSAAEAIRDTGYDGNYAPQAGHIMSQRIQRNWPELLQENGLGDKEVIQRYILPALEAKDTIHFARDGIVMETR